MAIVSPICDRCEAEIYFEQESYKWQHKKHPTECPKARPMDMEKRIRENK